MSEKAQPLVWHASGIVGEHMLTDVTFPVMKSWESDVEAEELPEADGLGVGRIEVNTYADNYKALFLEVYGLDRERTEARWHSVATRLKQAKIRDMFWEGQRNAKSV